MPSPFMACAAVVVIVVIIIIIVVVASNNMSDSDSDSTYKPQLPSRCSHLQDGSGTKDTVPTSEQTKKSKQTAYNRYKDACKHRDIGDSDRRNPLGPRVSRLSHTGTNYMDLFGTSTGMADIARRKQQAIDAQPAHVLQVPSNAL